MRYVLMPMMLTALAGGALTARGDNDNRLPNGSFESGMDGWRCLDGRPRSEGIGRGKVVRDHACHGQAAFFLEKAVANSGRPQLWSDPIAIQPGGYYEVRARVEASATFVLLTTIAQGSDSLRRTHMHPPTEGWKEITLRLHAPADAKNLRVGFALRGRPGRMWIDDVRLAATKPFDEPGEVPQAEAARADAHHRLIELGRRTRIKPYDLLRLPAGHFASERLVFRDTASGTTLWKMTHNPGINRHGYSNVLVWNADGSRMLLRGDRPGSIMWWLVAPDGSQWAPFPRDCHGWIYWDPLDPNKVYSADPSDRGTPREALIYQTDVSTAKSQLVWRLPVATDDWKLVPPSHDGKKFLVRETRMGADGKPRTFGVLLNADGTGEPQPFDLGLEAGQTWFLKRPDYSFMFATYSEARGDGSLDRQWVCEPAKNGAVRVLDKAEHFNHAGVSPSGKWVACQTAEGGVWITDVESGARRQCVRGPHTGGCHLSWECDDHWLVASMGNSIYEVQVDQQRARLVCVPNTYHSQRTECEPESSPDGTKFAYASAMMGDCDVYVAVERLPDPPRNVRRSGRLLTWDPPERCRELAGYCVYRGGKPLGRDLVHECRYELPEEGDGYAVAAVEHSGLESFVGDHDPPPVPNGLRATAASPNAVALEWQPSPAADVSYYNVYCSSRSTPDAAQENRVASPSEPRLLDWGLQAGTDYHYVVTAVDCAGNESHPCASATVTTHPIERALDRIAVGKPLGKQTLAVPFDAPRDERYLFWVEIKAGRVASNQSLYARIDGGKAIRWEPLWDAVSVGHDNPRPIPLQSVLEGHATYNPWQTLKAGEHRLELSLPNGSANILSVTLTNDAGFVPAGITGFRVGREE